jgi:hypothetical protein
MRKKKKKTDKNQYLRRNNLLAGEQKSRWFVEHIRGRNYQQSRILIHYK